MNGFLAMLIRDYRRYRREPERIPGRLLQPVAYLIFMGLGFGGNSTLGRGESYATFVFPGVVGLAIATSTAYSGANIVVDRETGFLRGILVAPVSRRSLALGKVASGGLFGAVHALPLLIFLPFLGIAVTPLKLLGMCCAMLACASAIASASSALACRLDISIVMQVVVHAFVFPMYFASGALFPLQKAPGWLQTLAYGNPIAYGVDLMRWSLLGDGFFQPLFAFAMLVAMTGIFTWSTIRGFEKGDDL